MLIRLINIGLIDLSIFIALVNSKCVPIHSIVNGQLVTQVDPLCMGKENALDASVKCPMLENPENGFMIGLCQPIAGFTCRFGCVNGFTISSPNHITCLNTGQWSSAPPVCENHMTSNCDVNALKVVFKNGYINCNQNEHSQLICRFTCLAGFVLTGSSILNCQSNGRFDAVPPTCVLIDNSLAEYNHASLTSPNFVYSKPFNYYMTSNSLNSIQCPQMNHLKSGSTSCDCVTGNIQVGCICRFYCNDHHYLIGSPMVTCTNTGNWSSTSPSCRRGKSCALPENLERNVFLLHCDTSSNGKCLYRCRGNFYFVDSSGKIKSNKISLYKNDFEIESKSSRNRKQQKTDFTLKTTRCLATGKWSEDFVCDVEAELDSLNKLHLNLTNNHYTSTYTKRRRRRRRRPYRRLTPIRLVGRPNRILTRPRRRRRRPSRRSKN